MVRPGVGFTVKLLHEEEHEAEGEAGQFLRRINLYLEKLSTMHFIVVALYEGG